MVEVTAVEDGVTMGEAEIRPQANVDGAAGDRKEHAEAGGENASDEAAAGVSALGHSVRDMICRRGGWSQADKERAFGFARKFAELIYRIRSLGEMGVGAGIKP